MAMLDRREFMRRAAISGIGAGTALGLAVGSRADEADTTLPQVQRYARLGRTELQVADIGFGSSCLRGDTELVRHALDRGVNYFDCAEGYTGGAAEQTIGRVLSSDRERVILASKTKAYPGDRFDDFMQRLERSLERLRTDRIDVYFNHAINSIDRISVDEWYEFLKRAKKQGKIRYTGVSGHGGKLVECLEKGAPERCRHHCDEGPARRASERHATLRNRTEHIRAVGLPLGSERGPGGLVGRDDAADSGGRRVPRGLGCR